MILAMQLGSPVAAEPTIEQLTEIRELLAANDVAALRAYVARNPELAEGNDDLAILLRKFMLEAKHLPNYLSDSGPSDVARSAQSPGGDDDNNNGSY